MYLLDKIINIYHVFIGRNSQPQGVQSRFNPIGASTSTVLNALKSVETRFMANPSTDNTFDYIDALETAVQQLATDLEDQRKHNEAIKKQLDAANKERSELRSKNSEIKDNQAALKETVALLRTQVQQGQNPAVTSDQIKESSSRKAARR
ncbi:MAG: hypothetical protein JSR17_06975 [Proteobacteria bacterium]|nr:hypothetical protein [Pseudomonadota bacterium]